MCLKSEKKRKATPVIDICRVTKYYGIALGVEDLSLRVGEGEIFGFLGPNGAGKSTTIRLMLNLLRPSFGEIRLFNQPVRNRSSDIFSRVGNVPGELKLYEDMTGDSFLTYMNRFCGKEASLRTELTRAFGLARDVMKKKIRHYSHGMKQKLAIVQALQDDPDLIVMDEPSEGLDPINRTVLYHYLKCFSEKGKTVFFSSHDLAEVEKVCHRVGLVKNGRLITQESISELKQKVVRRMDVTFGQEVPKEVSELTDTRIIERDTCRIVLAVTGDINPVLRLLARFEVSNLIFPEPSLEDTFMAFYEKES